MNAPSIRIERADRGRLADVVALARHIEAEDHPNDPQAGDRAPNGIRRSLERFDWLNSDCVWILLAYIGNEPAGLALYTRIPKLDARCGFLYLDELHVLEPHRRHGVGRALLDRGVELAGDLGLAGIRLLARPDNVPARALYEAAGLQRNDTLLYTFRFDQFPLQT